MADAYTPNTTKVRLGPPVNAYLWTTFRDVPDEMVLPAQGDNMVAQLGPLWADNLIVGVTDEPKGSMRRVTFTHFKNTTVTDQNLRNCEIQDDVLFRTYILLRENYPATGGASDYKLPAIVVGDTDPKFPRYGFTEETLLPATFGLDPVFVVVQRIFRKIKSTVFIYSDDLERQMEETREYIPKGSNVQNSVPGRSVSIEDSHTQHDIRITNRIVPKAGDSSSDGILIFPVELKQTAGDESYDFPPLLLSVEFPNRWAFASNGDLTDYDEDFIPDFKRKFPSPGPYPSRRLRFLTDDPATIQNLFPLSPKPVPQEEVIYAGSQYAIASPEQVKAHASMSGIPVPPSVHPEIEIVPPDSPVTVIYTQKLAATQGYSNYAGLAILTIGYSTSQGPSGTYLVEVIQINASSVYSGISYEWGSGSIGSGLTGSTGQIPPVMITVAPNAANTQAFGTASSNSIIRVYSGTGSSIVEEGRGESDSVGNFAVSLSPVRTNPVQLYATARRGGLLSPALGFMTNDLAPVTPTAALHPGTLALLTGTAEKGSTVTIALDPVAQVVSLTVTGGPVSSDDSLLFKFAAAVFGASSPVERSVGVLTGETTSQVASKIANNLVQSGPISAHWEIDVSSSTVTATKKVPEMNDATAIMTLVAGLGISDSTSTITTVGRGTVTVIADPADGFFEYIFSPALTDGDEISITATDAGGTSPVLELIADAATPAAPTATVFATDEYDRIVGEAAAGVTVAAILNGSQKGTALVDGMGDFSLDLDKGYVSGEVFEVYAYVTGNQAKRSPTVLVTAYNLNLPVPAYSEEGTLIFGTLPASALALAAVGDIKVVVRYEANVGSEVEVDIFANLEWNFDILDVFSLDAPPENGQRFEIFYRFPQADGQPAIKAYPKVDIPTPSFAWATPISVAGSPPQIPPFQCTKATSIAYANSWTSAFSPFLTEWYRTDDVTFIRPIKSPTFGLPTQSGAIGLGSSYLYPGTNGAVLAARAPYMGPGTKVVIRFPGSAKPTQEIIWATAPDVERPAFDSINAGLPDRRPAVRAANIGEFATISVANWTNPAGTPAWGDGKATDSYMTVANLKLVIPPVMEIYVEAPDGRTNTVTQPRSAVSPFMA